MSRLIVKGLPKRYGDAELRKLFSPYGDVTDARVVKTPQGQSRCFGFVGFRLKQHASRAHSAMKRVYVDTCPVKVDFALAMGDPSLPRPWSRYSKGSSQYDRQNSQTNNSDHPNNPKSPAKENEKRARAPQADLKVLKNNKEKQSKDASNKDDEFAAFEELFAPTARRVQNISGVQVKEKTQFVKSRKNGAKGSVVERKHVTFDSDGSEADEDDNMYQDIPNDTSIHMKEDVVDPAEAGNSTALNTAVSDMDYFKSKVASSALKKPSAELEAESVGTETSVEKGDTDVAKTAAVDTDGCSEVIGGEEVGGNEHDDARVASSDKKSSDNSKLNTEEHRDKSFSEKNIENHPNAGETGRLLVRNLAFSVSEDELEKAFEPFGDVAEVHIVRNSSDGKSRGMGFIQYTIAEQAVKAMMSLDGSFLSGRILHVLPARPKLYQSGLNTNFNTRYAAKEKPGSSTFKTARENEQKIAAKSGDDGDAQYAMHMSKDAVAEVAAERHGVSKAELYGAARGESSIAAVRLAIAEASIIGETRAFLVQNGLNLDIVERMAKNDFGDHVSGRQKRRSRTGFLVKDLPAGTTELELRQLFEKYGKLNRLLVVPSGLLGVVQFTTASSAKLAYDNCAYSDFKGSVVFLQWLPNEAFEVKKKDSTPHDENESENKTLKTPVAPHVEQVTKNSEKDDEEESEDHDNANEASVYVKNLSFETRDGDLRSHFEAILRKRPKLVSSLRSAKVAMKRGPEGKEGTQLSMGFGFLEFRTHEDAKEAVKLGQNSNLDGHELKLQISTKSNDDKRNGLGSKRKRSDSSKGKAGSKLIVRNVAFEATKKDIRQLFASFGQLKTVRMPSKMDGSHRGFAFVEFISKNEAIAAMDALSAAHLYGRHLVLEFAEQSNDSARSVAELQERAAVQFASKRRRVEGVDSDHRKRPAARDENDDDAMMRDELYA